MSKDNDAYVYNNESPMYSVRLRPKAQTGLNNENIGPGSYNIRGKMGGTFKSFGMKLNQAYNFEERPGPQN